MVCARMRRGFRCASDILYDDIGGCVIMPGRIVVSVKSVTEEDGMSTVLPYLQSLVAQEERTKEVRS